MKFRHLTYLLSSLVLSQSLLLTPARADTLQQAVQANQPEQDEQGNTALIVGWLKSA